MLKKRIIQSIRIPYLNQFKQGLLWNLFDSVGSQGILVLYHILFRALFGTALHGIMGCMLSLFYLALTIGNFGLDSTLAPFLEFIIHSRKSMRTFITRHMIPQIIVWTIFALFWSIFYPHAAALPLASTITSSLHPELAALMGLFFIVESLRKTARAFLHLTFYTALTALVEVGGTAFYLLSILMIYYVRGTLSLEESWQALLASGLIQLMALIIGLIHFYRTLPTHPAQSIPSDAHLSKRIIKTRLFVWANQCMKQLFSGNFLVPICALQFGIEQASLMKIMTSISYWVTLIANKAFGVTSNALLAHLKFRSLETQRAAFSYLTYLLNQALYFLVIFLLINGKKIALLQLTPTATISWSLLYFLLIIAFFESLFILYEKWFIFEEKTHYYVLFNGLSFAVLYSFLSLARSPLAIALLVITLRLMTFVLLTLFSFYWWRIWPSWRPSVKTIIGSLALSGIFYVLL